MSGELDGALGRIIEAFAKIKASLRQLFETVKEDSERREGEYKDLVSRLDRINEKLIIISGQLSEAGGDLETLRDRTPPLGVPLHRPEDLGNGSNGHRKDNGSGSAVAIRDGKVRLALPASWGLSLLKVAVSAGLGGLLLRCVQWLITK